MCTIFSMTITDVEKKCNCDENLEIEGRLHEAPHDNNQISTTVERYNTVNE